MCRKEEVGSERGQKSSTSAGSMTDHLVGLGAVSVLAVVEQGKTLSSPAVKDSPGLKRYDR